MAEKKKYSYSGRRFYVHLGTIGGGDLKSSLDVTERNKGSVRSQKKPLGYLRTGAAGGKSR